MVSTRSLPDLPTSPPTHWDRSTAIDYAIIAMNVELHTIPLYLYSMYSIKSDNDGRTVRKAIRDVVEQEMLHLTLAGNLLSALDGGTYLYDNQFIPQFPQKFFDEKKHMNLQHIDLDALKSFIRLETQQPPTTEVLNILNEPVLHARVRNDALVRFKSIGDFYEEFEKGISKLPDTDFAHNQSKQFSGDDFFGNEMIIIKDGLSAKIALKKIIEQGEGKRSPAHGTSHCDVFVSLYHGIKNKTSKIEFYKVPSNPKTADYRQNVFVYKLSLSFDAAYCYLLLTIQMVWKTGNESDREPLIQNINDLMRNVLTPIADLLVKQAWGQGNAAPCFNMYPPQENGVDPAPLEPEKLHESLIKEAGEAEAASKAEGPQALVGVQSIVTSIKNLPVIKKLSQ